MDKQTFLNNKYLQLCQQLGDAQVKLDQLTEHITSIKAQITTLNTAFPLIAELESAQRAAAAAAEKDLKNAQSKS